MDWNAAIEKNREALKRVLAMLVAMAGLRGQLALQDGAPPQGAAAAEKGKPSPAPTLPRRLHRAVCKLLRPAEAAARRLIIVAARDLVAPPPSPRKPKPKTMEPLLRSLGIAVMASPADLVGAMAAARRAAAERAARPRGLSLPLIDPLPRWPRPWRPIARSVPRIRSLDTPFRPLPAPPSPDDPVSAARLALRLEALGRALDDLPGQAQRFARWRARSAAAAVQEKERYVAAAQNKGKPSAADAPIRKTRTRFHRVWPLKPGRPPGWRRRPTHEIHDILNVVHGLAHWAMERPDTS